MEYQKYNYYRDGKKKSKIFGKKSLLFFLFIVFLGIIVLFTVYDGNLTGNLIREDFNLNNSFPITFTLNLPEITLKGDYSLIQIEVPANQRIYLNNNNLSLNYGINSLILNDFYGKIVFDKNSITYLEGKVDSISINGIPISNKNGKSMKLNIDSSIDYTNIIFDEDIFFGDFEFNAVGNLRVGDDSFILKDELISIKDLYGKLNSRKGSVDFNGFSSNIEIFGLNNKITISK